MRRGILALLLVCFIAVGFILGSLAYASTGVAEKDAKFHLQEAYSKLPLYFIENKGQVDKKIRFYEKGNGHTTFFTKDGVYLSLTKGQETKDTRLKEGSNPSELQTLESEIVQLTFLGANKNPKIVAEQLQEGKVNYLTGNDSKKWRTNIPTYKSVLYKEVYKGIDIRFYGSNRQLEYDIIVKPGADPSRVRFSYEGIEGLNITAEGNLEISLKEGKMVQKKPYIYQETDGKRVEIEGKFKVQNVIAHEQLEHGNLKDEIAMPSARNDMNRKFTYSFQIASYDKKHPLIIDPILVYSTFIGGSGREGTVTVDIDKSGSAYLVGTTPSSDFPVTPGAHDTVLSAGDVFVTKLSADGSALVYSTYLGGSSSEYGRDIVIDALGNAYVTGDTGSADFPITPNAYDTNLKELFLAKLSTDGSALEYSTFLWSGHYGVGVEMDVDPSGNAYVLASTLTSGLPVTVGAYGPANNGGGDLYINKISADGSALLYATYLGGSSYELSKDIKVDSAGNAYLTGETYSSDYPTTLGAYDTSANVRADVFVSKLSTDGTTLVYSTFLADAGNHYFESNAISVDGSGSAYVVGFTDSPDLPVTAGAYDTSLNGTWTFDTFVTKLSPDGSSITYCTYLGGSGNDFGRNIAVDASGDVYVVGDTNSNDFPVSADAYDLSFNGGIYGGGDIFVSRLSSNGSSLLYSTYLGGSGNDYGKGVAVDSSGDVYIAGETMSDDFPVTPGSFDTAYNGSQDAFVVKFTTVTTIHIQIDIKPGTETNTIKLGDHGNIPVAIFGSAEFDVASIDPSTLNLNGAAVRIVDGKKALYSFGDENKDGILDMMVMFDRGQVELTAGSTYATVKGKTLDGKQFEGTGSVIVIE